MKIILIVILFSTILMAQDSTYLKKYADEYKLVNARIEQADEQIKAWAETKTKSIGAMEVLEKLFADEKKKIDSLGENEEKKLKK